MKTKIIFVAVALCSLLQARSTLAEHALAAGARYHTSHSEFIELPYDNGDITYLLGYEYHEAAAFWQLLVGYTPSISEGDDGRGLGVDYVITPQINLLFEDRNWLAGVGALASYIRMDDDSATAEGTTPLESDWTEVYWQVMIGYQIPLPGIKLEITAYYPFEKWKTFSDFDASDIEFGALLKRAF